MSYCVVEFWPGNTRRDRTRPVFSILRRTQPAVKRSLRLKLAFRLVELFVLGSTDRNREMLIGECVRAGKQVWKVKRKIWIALRAAKGQELEV